MRSGVLFALARILALALQKAMRDRRRGVIVAREWLRHTFTIHNNDTPRASRAWAISSIRWN